MHEFKISMQLKPYVTLTFKSEFYSEKGQYRIAENKNLVYFEVFECSTQLLKFRISECDNSMKR